MQLKLGFLEAPTPDQETTVWTTLDETVRADAVQALARLVAKAAVDRSQRVADEENGNE